MPLIKKLTGSGSKPATPIQPKQKVAVTLNLTKKSPSKALNEYSILLYGAKGIGKTSLASKFPGAVFLNLEPGTKALRTADNYVKDWDTFVAYVDEVVKINDKDMTVIVDVVDIAYEMIYKKICDQLKIESPTEENDFGATWKKIRRLFREQLDRLMRTGGGAVFLSHDTEKEIELRDGSKVDRVQPTLGKQALGELEGLVDIVAYYAYEDEDRVLKLSGSQTLIAKSRPEENFIAVSGERVNQIPMGKTSDEAYANLIKAFNNKQETADGKEKRSAPAKQLLKIKK
jgi:phage nucleotide-binding protein